MGRDGRTVAVALSFSSPQNFPGMSFTQNASGGFTFPEPVFLQAGTGPVVTAPGRIRWGDYAGAVPDPADPGSAWPFGEFGQGGREFEDWGTYIAKIRPGA